VYQESAQESENKEGRPGRDSALVVGGIVVLLVALGITLALAISGTVQHKPGPAPKVAPVEDPPKQVGGISHPRPEATSKVALPAPETPAPLAGPGGPKALAPGEPPLTQDWLNRWTAYTEWMLDIRLTGQQRRECQQLWVQHWKETGQSRKDRFWAYATGELKWSDAVAKRSEAERNELRAQQQPLFLAGLRRSSDPDERMLVALYEAAHKPGGEQNPILVAGTPALTQDMVDTWRRFVEWVLDVRLTEQQRQEYQHLFINDWKKSHQAAKDYLLKTATAGLLGQLPLLNDHTRNLLRAEVRPKVLADLRNGSGAELSRWLLAIYESAHRPGGERNPVLVPGNPALTQHMVSRFGDFVEWVLDLRVTGGLTARQRQVLRDVIVHYWKKGDDSWRAGFLQHLKTWSVIAQLSDAQRTKLYEKLHPAFVARLRNARDHQLSQWLLAIYHQEQNQPERRAGEGKDPANPNRRRHQ
jgi:hypothetical protein